ncbi:hypothetical protein [Massilia antarctica]|uniref:hypothetical protein n=1 Tax=Massilia antarctica TaxID=2765360 RepID=UPI0006BB7B9C|nr:hypothetical protein [Massilia sp. H27-R4]MCY0915342.1 hypothetical protein [Massilia sp. H27-R4]CUI05804.1 hypothetical protein BN2497_6385 [Janthinobacterium sp. CG23_2]CUU29590.1 hypothetical protein BN3177_6385 [Janthinobacterium sp. CG23_2]
MYKSKLCLLASVLSIVTLTAFAHDDGNGNLRSTINAGDSFKFDPNKKMVLEKPAAPAKDGKPAKPAAKSQGGENAGDTFKFKPPAKKSWAHGGARDPAPESKDAPEKAGKQ